MDTFSSLLSRGGLSYDRLLNFCRIAEAGGISKAADSDVAKQSLYSRQIRELEEFFGVELKRRQGKGLVITEAGQRLAQLARAHLLGLEDFRREAAHTPKRLSIASGNSVIEWVLLPKIASLRRALPETFLDFYSERTNTTVSKLTDMTLDIGLIREDAVRPPLEAKRLYAIGYSVFIPRRLARDISPDNLKDRLATLPLATSVGGQFRETLMRTSAKAKWPLEIILSCSSFTQAARVVQAGDCGAILPDIASHEFDQGTVVQMPLPFLRRHARQLCIAWNPRLVEVRPFLKAAIEEIEAMVRLQNPAVEHQ